MGKRRDDSGMVALTDAVVGVMLIALIGVAVFTLASRIAVTEADRQAAETMEQIAARWLSAPDPPRGCAPAPHGGAAPAPPKMRPGSPAGFNDGSQGWITLEWEHPRDPSISHYRYRLSPQPPESHPSAPWVVVPGSNADTTSAVIDGLLISSSHETNSYVVRIEAVNGAGAGHLRVPGRTQTGRTLDTSGPPHVAAEDSDPCWLPAPGSVCQTPVFVASDCQPAPDWAALGCPAGARFLTGETWCVSVADAEGPCPAPPSAASPPARPNRVTEGEITGWQIPARSDADGNRVPGEGWLEIAWAHPADPSITGYEVEWSAPGTASRAASAPIPGSGPDTTTAVIRGLAPHTAHIVWLRARNAAGLSPALRIPARRDNGGLGRVSTSLARPGAPWPQMPAGAGATTRWASGPPPGVVWAPATGSESVLPAPDGVRAHTTGGANLLDLLPALWTDRSAPAPPAAEPGRLTGCAPPSTGVTRTVTVTAAGGGWALTWTRRMSADPPAPPAPVGASVAITAGRGGHPAQWALLSWAAADDDSPDPGRATLLWGVDRYKTAWRVTGAAAWTSGPDIGPSHRTALICGLPPAGAVYEFRVGASSPAGVGWSAPVTYSAPGQVAGPAIAAPTQHVGGITGPADTAWPRPGWPRDTDGPGPLTARANAGARPGGITRDSHPVTALPAAPAGGCDIRVQ